MDNTNNKFNSITLDRANSCIAWHSFADYDSPCHKLVIKQLLLGAEAADDEYNGDEVSTDRDNIKIPVDVLTASELRVINANMEFYESQLTFKLIQGIHKYYILGQDFEDDIDVKGNDD